MVAADCNRFAGGACFLQRLGNLSGLEVGCQSAGHEHVDDMRAVNLRTYSGYYQSSNQKCRSCVLRRDAQGQEEFLNGFDFANTNAQLLNVTLLYNDTSPWYWGPPFVLRLANPLRALLDSWLNVHLEAADARTYSAGMAGIKEMPRSASFLALDIGSAMGPFFCTLAFHVLFPTLVVALVYEKEMRLRVMMRMMGLGTTAYWTINYLFWCLVYAVFCFIFMSLASIVRLPSGYRYVFVSVPCPRALGRSCMLPHVLAFRRLSVFSALWPGGLVGSHFSMRVGVGLTYTIQRPPGHVMVLGLDSPAIITGQDYSMHLVLQFLFINHTVSCGMLCAALFRSSRFAQVVLTLWILGASLVAWTAWDSGNLLNAETVPSSTKTAITLVPVWSLYRAWMEFLEYAQVHAVCLCPGKDL